LILRTAARVNATQEKHQVLVAGEGNDFETRPRFGLMEVVYEWARGMSFNKITDLTDVLEGTIVRVITRIDETCREVENPVSLANDRSKMQHGSLAMLRSTQRWKRRRKRLNAILCLQHHCG
jgi:antiviral helicase SKI2